MSKIRITFLKEKTDTECRELAGHYYRRARRAEKERDQLREQVEALSRDADRYRCLLEAVRREIPHRKGSRGNAPRHCHSVPGIWDEDNGALAGKECAWCKVWNEAVSAMEPPKGGDT